MIIQAKVYLSIICLIWLIGCSSSEDPITAESNSDLIGDWSTTCRQDSGSFVISHLELDNESVVFREENFDDNACTSKLFELDFSGSLQIGSRVELSDSTIAVEADYKYNSISVILNSQDVIDDYENQNVCNRADWQQSVSYDVTDCFFDEPINTVFSIFAQEDNILYRGNKSPGAAGDTSETRHVILERLIPYSMQSTM